MNGIVGDIFKLPKKAIKATLDVPGDVLGMGKSVFDTAAETVGIKSKDAGKGIAKVAEAYAPETSGPAPVAPIDEPPVTLPEQPDSTSSVTTERRKAAASVRRRRGRQSTILTALDDAAEGSLGG